MQKYSQDEIPFKKKNPTAENDQSHNPIKNLKLLQEKLFNLWDKFNIPYNHREIFVKNFKTIKIEELIKIVEIEISKMEKKCSLIQVTILI